MQVAMTVGATRMQVMLNAEQTKLSATLEAAAPTFIAADVVPQAGGT